MLRHTLHLQQVREGRCSCAHVGAGAGCWSPAAILQHAQPVAGTGAQLPSCSMLSRWQVLVRQVLVHQVLVHQVLVHQVLVHWTTGALVRQVLVRQASEPFPLLPAHCHERVSLLLTHMPTTMTQGPVVRQPSSLPPAPSVMSDFPFPSLIRPPLWASVPPTLSHSHCYDSGLMGHTAILPLTCPPPL